MIFSHVLYQLSYPGIATAAVFFETGERWSSAYGEEPQALQPPITPPGRYPETRAGRATNSRRPAT